MPAADIANLRHCSHFCPAGRRSSELAQLCDVLTIEIEHVNCGILSALDGPGKNVQPSPETISVVQDKHAQKNHFKLVRRRYLYSYTVYRADTLLCRILLWSSDTVRMPRI